MQPLSRLTPLSTLFTLLCSGALAQAVPSERNAALATYRTMADALLREEVLPRIIDALPPPDRTFARAIPLEVTLERDPFRTGLIERDQTRAITISAAFLVAVDIASDATAFAIHTRRYQDLPGFAAQYSDFVRNQWWEKVGTGPPPRMFSSYIGWPDEASRAYRDSSEYRALRLAMMRQSLAWIGAHYMGHLVLDRRDPPRKNADARVREGKIDAFATDLAYSAGFSPMPPLVNTVFFVSIDHPSRDRSPTDWVCRAADVTQRGLDRLARERHKSSPRDEHAVRRGLTPEKGELERIRRVYGCNERQPPGRRD